MALGPDTLVYSSDPDHCFIVFRLLPDGRWVGWWSEEQQATVEFRGQCTCGWEGPSILGDLRSGREDELDRERGYDYWSEHHARVEARPYIL
jgi:hypothetical protein